MDIKELFKDRRAKWAAGGAIGVIAVAAVAVAVSGAPAAPEAVAENGQPEVTQVADVQEEPKAALFPVSVIAEGWTDESTPVVVKLEEAEPGEGAEAKAYYHAATASEVASGSSLMSVPAGAYKVSYISPINADGSIYRVPEAQEATVAPIETAPEGHVEGDGSDQETSDSEFEAPVFEPVPADQVTKEDVSSILEQLGEACARGDETLSGDKGQQIIDQATENASKAPNVGEGGAAEAEAKAEEKKEEAEPQEPAPGGETSSGGTTQQPSKPAHEHTWVTKQVQTGTRQVQTGIRQVQTGTKQVQVGSEPIYENRQVQVGEKWYFPTSDGQVFESVAAAEQHCKDMLLNQGIGISITTDYSKPIYETRQVQVGTKPIYETQPVYENQPVYSTEPVYSSVTVCATCGVKQ